MNWWKTPVAKSTPFDAGSSGMLSTEANAAIIEAFQKAAGTSKGYVFAFYNGNAGSGRYLEFFPNIPSSDAPLFSSAALDIIEIVSATTSTNATCTIGFYNDTTLLYTQTFTAVKRKTDTGAPILFTLPASGQLKIKVDSGSINVPHLYFVAKGA